MGQPGRARYNASLLGKETDREMTMKVKFYGTRGSAPAPGQQYSSFGGNTLCVLVTFEDGRILILDAGTGLRNLGNEIIAGDYRQFDNICIAVTHTHWDHIEGLRFFKPSYDSRRHFTIATLNNGRRPNEFADALSLQMQRCYFPLPLEKMGAQFTIAQVEASELSALCGAEITALKLNHPINTYSYRIHHDGKVLVYCTDVEHIDGIDEHVVAFAANADLLIHDAQYTDEELETRKGWGHSSCHQAIEVGRRAKVKQLALYHHDPDHTDDFLSKFDMDCKKRYPWAFLAKEGMEIIL